MWRNKGCLTCKSRPTQWPLNTHRFCMSLLSPSKLLPPHKQNPLTTRLADRSCSDCRLLIEIDWILLLFTKENGFVNLSQTLSSITGGVSRVEAHFLPVNIAACVSMLSRPYTKAGFSPSTGYLMITVSFIFTSLAGTLWLSSSQQLK